MNRSMIVALIAIIVLAGGFYLYFSSQKGKSESQQTGGHGATTTGGHQPVTQGQRTYEPEITSDTTNINSNQTIKFSYKIKNDKGEVLKNYETVREKIMHLIVVRKDLQNFQHRSRKKEFIKSLPNFSIKERLLLQTTLSKQVSHSIIYLGCSIA